MKNIVNDIYNQCERKLTAFYIDRLIIELEELKAEKEEAEMYEECANKMREEDPYNDVEKENCRAFSENIV